MADVSGSKNAESSAANSAGDPTVQDEDKPRINKRARSGVIGSSTDNSEDSEPDEKRPTFRLQPPTLIHGKAKPVPKSEDPDKGSGSAKCKFLQPSKLSAFTSATTANKVAPVETVATDPQPLVSSSNPFLFMAEKESTEETEESNEVENAVENDQKQPAEDSDKVNGNDAEEAKPDSTTDVDEKDKQPNEADSENLFAKAAEATSDNGGFVFGSKMEDRVVISTEGQSPSKDSGDGNSGSAAGFVFGQNLSERAKVSSSTDSNPSFMPSNESGASNSSSRGESPQNVSSPSSSDKKHSIGLVEDAAAHFLASQSKPKMPEIEVLTGEEDEKSVLQMQCKLHQFDAADQNWLERGVGSLHLNDGKYSDDLLHFQSRLVMRVHGSLRLVLNTKIWPQMTVERASKKSVRVSAQTDDGSIGVFLITGTINDAEQIFRALEYRVRHQKQLEEKRMAIEKQKKAGCDGKEADSSDKTVPEPETNHIEKDEVNQKDEVVALTVNENKSEAEAKSPATKEKNEETPTDTKEDPAVSKTPL